MNEKIAFKEVCDILNLLGTDYINKIPSKMYNYMIENKDENYITDIHENTNFEEIEISKEALEIISYINLQYWCNEEEKKILLKKYNDEIEKNQKSYADIFAKNTKEDNHESIPEKTEELVVTNKKNIFTRIKEYFKNLFKLIF